MDIVTEPGTLDETKIYEALPGIKPATGEKCGGERGPNQIKYYKNGLFSQKHLSINIRLSLLSLLATKLNVCVA